MGRRATSVGYMRKMLRVAPLRIILVFRSGGDFSFPLPFGASLTSWLGKAGTGTQIVPGRQNPCASPLCVQSPICRDWQVKSPTRSLTTFAEAKVDKAVAVLIPSCRPLPFHLRWGYGGQGGRGSDPELPSAPFPPSLGLRWTRR